MNKKKRFNQIINDIKEVKIQGAREIAKKVVMLILWFQLQGLRKNF